MLEWALRYIKLGWAVLPLKGKLPLLEHGLTEASLNEEQIRAWWAKWPWANIGLVTGGAFFVLDIDIKKDGEETWDGLRMRYGGAEPDTLCAVTGSGGRHLCFAMPAFPVRNSVEKLGPGLDIRGIGGYIVAEPSIHPETKRAYAWDGLLEVEEQSIAAAPSWLLKLIQEAAQRPPASSPAALPVVFADGRRNDLLFRVGCGLRARGFEEDEIFASLAALDRTRCKPPIGEREVRTIAHSTMRYKPGKLRWAGGKPVEEQAEEPVSGADIEKAVDDVIAQNNLQLAISLAADIIKLSPVAELLAITKLKTHFGRAWPSGAFEDTLRRLRKSSNLVEMPARQEPEAPGGDGPGYPLTDSGNAERLIARHGGIMRYCVEMKKWLIWDKCRWIVDEQGTASRYGLETAREHRRASVGNGPASAWALRSESHMLLNAALNRAATIKGVPVLASELDSHPFLLNCRNGVVDLRSGKLLPHDPGYLITKLCDVEYDANAKCDRFLDFVLWTMGQNPDAEPSGRAMRLLSFLQKAFGYALTGDVSEKCVFIFYGSTGDNGKTTLLNVFRLTLGKDYCAQLDINTLMASRMTDSAMRADLAALRGARFVITSEVETGSQLGEAKLKYLTGMGEIKTRKLYENPIEFEPTHKLFMDCNYRPRVRGADDAIWQRLKSIPFDAKIDRSSAEFDLHLKDKLIAEAPGILAWAVRGCVQWKRDGLGAPPEIADANDEWRESDDPLKDFIEDCCEVGPERWVQVGAISHAYAWWCGENRETRPLGRVGFGERMKSKGFRYARSRRDDSNTQLRTWEGIGLRDGLEAEMALVSRPRKQGGFNNLEQ